MNETLEFLTGLKGELERRVGDRWLFKVADRETVLYYDTYNEQLKIYANGFMRACVAVSRDWKMLCYESCFVERCSLEGPEGDPVEFVIRCLGRELYV